VGVGVAGGGGYVTWTAVGVVGVNT
jgi:hypothetical protein